MNLITINNTNKKQFIKFYEDRYINNPIKRNSMSSMLKGLLNGKSVMCNSVDLEPLMVVDNGKIIMIAILAYAHRMPEFLQISFFEAIEDNPIAFDLILDKATILAKSKGAAKISGTLNIHVNYGLGFLASDFDSWQGFGTPHNPEFYNTLFQNAGFESIDMVSFKKDMKQMKELFPSRIKEKLKKRYTVREVNFKYLEKEANIYTEINNQAFTEHLFYYQREASEDLELFKEFKYLLKSNNLLYVEKDEVPVGFMLWYPDFHKLMKPNETVGIRTVIRNKLFPNRMKTFKIVEIGIIPSERDRGAIMALFDYCYECAKDKYESFESGWVLVENVKSMALGQKLGDGVYKHYKAFIKDVD